MESNTPKIEARVKALEEKTSSAIDLKEVGDGLDLTSGVLSLKSHASADGNTYGKGSPNLFGHLKVIDSYEGDAPTAADGVVLSPAGIEKMIENAGLGDITPDWTQNGNSDLGTVLSDGSLLITKSGTFTVPATGVYSVSVVGGGGNGGSVTFQAQAGSNTGMPNYGGGGGGGAGLYTTANLSLAKGAKIQATVGAAGGTTTFSTVTGVGGGGGGNGSYTSYSISGTGVGGALGTSYGYGGSKGGSGTEHSCIGGSGASSNFPVLGGTAKAGGMWNAGDYRASGGSAGSGYGAGGGGGGGGYPLGTMNGSVASGGAGSQGAILVMRVS